MNKDLKDNVWYRDGNLLFMLKDGVNYKTVRLDGMADYEIKDLHNTLQARAFITNEKEAFIIDAVERVKDYSNILPKVINAYRNWFGCGLTEARETVIYVTNKLGLV